MNVSSKNGLSSNRLLTAAQVVDVENIILVNKFPATEIVFVHVSRAPRGRAVASSSGITWNGIKLIGSILLMRGPISVQGKKQLEHQFPRVKSSCKTVTGESSQEVVALTSLRSPVTGRNASLLATSQTDAVNIEREFVEIETCPTSLLTKDRAFLAQVGGRDALSASQGDCLRGSRPQMGGASYHDDLPRRRRYAWKNDQFLLSADTHQSYCSSCLSFRFEGGPLRPERLHWFFNFSPPMATKVH